MVMVSQCEYALHYKITYFIMIKMVDFVLCILPQFKKKKKTILAAVIPWHRSSRGWKFFQSWGVSCWLAHRDNKPVLNISLCVSEPPSQSYEVNTIWDKWVKQTWVCPQRASSQYGRWSCGLRAFLRGSVKCHLT